MSIMMMLILVIIITTMIIVIIIYNEEHGDFPCRQDIGSVRKPFYCMCSSLGLQCQGHTCDVDADDDHTRHHHHHHGNPHHHL